MTRRGNAFESLRDRWRWRAAPDEVFGAHVVDRPPSDHMSAEMAYFYGYSGGTCVAKQPL
jgi:hypothetical protein